MKRLRIWLNGFTLVQQYLVVSFIAILVFAVFIFQFLNINIDNFTNAQMISYLHRSQTSYLDAKNMDITYADTNVEHFVYYSEENSDPLSIEAAAVVNNVDVSEVEDIKDGIYKLGNDTIVYSIKNCDKYYLISIISDVYRGEFESALVSGIMNSVVIVVSIIFLVLMLWVYSLIRPLNLIRNYIKKIKDGESAELTIKRNDEIGEVAEAVVDMNEELSHQQRIREEMIQNISHDLKTPIATIKSYSESIKDGVYPYGTLEKSVDVIIEHADRLEKKVYSLITYNKVGYLEDTQTGDTVNMSEVIKKVILSCQVLRNDIEIDTSEVNTDVYFHGDEDAWRTVVENLLDNAIRYAKSKISFTLSDNLFEIFDDGDLMDKDRIEKLFKPYEKGNKGNFGLGLSIVKKVCETYGYNVVGENKANGVVFRIYRNVYKNKKNKNTEVKDA